MNESTQARNVLTLFATYGFRKASMGDIADAAGVSRQSIYNQHGSKEAVLEWALAAFLSEITDRALAAMKLEGEGPTEALLAGFQAWIGDNIELLRGTPHGGELLETAIASAANSKRDYEKEFADAVAELLRVQGLASKTKDADDLNFVLQAASKGLLLKSKTNEDYSDGMRRVLATLIRA